MDFESHTYFAEANLVVCMMMLNEERFDTPLVRIQ